MFLRSKCDINSDWTGVRELAKKGANIVGSEHGLVVDANDVGAADLVVFALWEEKRQEALLLATTPETKAQLLLEVISRDGKAKIRARAANREHLCESVSEGTGANQRARRRQDRVQQDRGAMLSVL